MANFLKFIDEDIETKKTLLSTMPTKTKTDIKKYDNKIASISEKYNEYSSRVRKYLVVKSRSFNFKNKKGTVDGIKKEVDTLEHVRFILNPSNTFFEKMGFDNLLYQISNYHDFNFKSLNEIINQFLDKFELAGVYLVSSDFDYTYYVHEYMTSFLEVRNNKSENYDKVSEIFERIYWVNPEIIEHVELNFRKLIKKHSKDFINYINKLKQEIKSKNKIETYDDCLKNLKEAYDELNNKTKEDISDIIELAKTGEIDINDYFEDNKVRKSTYSELTIDALKLDDKEVMEKFYEKLERLKINIEEYINYIKFLPLINDFKNEYGKPILNTSKNSNSSNDNKKLSDIESQILAKETKLDKINKKIFSGKIGFFKTTDESTLKQLKIDSIKLAKELYDLYKAYDKECFKGKVQAILNNTLTISELLHLYYSYDYFKKKAIKKVFDIDNYDEIIEYSRSFDSFAMNPTNVIINGIPVFNENNIARIIVNKYRLYNINILEENLDPDELNILLDKIQLLLRINEIEQSSTTVEKIWFMAQVEKIKDNEDKK